eukprot:TRINITY_DN5970_c0_g1_i1.p1 TRINITY_DN5970_c0_g1~~TRINITY_DN5970_c0_g1_i1.p1  ORF type:complete len:220 (+),score=31.91 TRINITY_DN5970_c0_g1_i1:127-786(+)
MYTRLGQGVCLHIEKRPQTTDLKCDLSEDWVRPNQIASDILLVGGAYHAGLEVHGQEWSYGVEGITRMRPRKHSVHIYRQSVLIGFTSQSEEQVAQFMAETMAYAWVSQDYNMFTHNCCNFTDAACRHLVGRAMPGWIDRFARVASSATSFADSIASTVASSSISGGFEEVEQCDLGNEGESSAPTFPTLLRRQGEGKNEVVLQLSETATQSERSVDED